MGNQQESVYIENEIKKRVNSWYLFLNQIFGIIGFSLGLGCLGTSSPAFYACISIIFITSLYIPGYLKRKQFIKFLRENNHPEFKMIKIFKQGLPFFIGYLFLFLVAFGVLESDTSFSSILELFIKSE
ncbi:hypothetical protein [Aliikangiella sp. G2MR2-5]|uniref:hypothetical protein n=1 Tax=Aliikangiella sp. G2MR2-5 TaxID=2788943 RepID=UPI0018A9E601|nr:hypothetical protein [Aliikangiella sp. G2MR2-5]